MEEAHKRYNNFIRSRLMMTEYEKKELYQYDKQISLEDKRREGIKEGMKKGIEKGKLEGIKEGKLEGERDKSISIAKTLKQMNMDDDSISKATGLSIEEIRKLHPDGKKL
ncbi:MAG: hypothetical protein KHX06_00005, partial [Brachyspira sp.]|nr:hypothetical protein [Brachyspira sp.]